MMREILMMPPTYIAGCIDEDLLQESMEVMLNTVSANCESGYQLDIDVLIRYVQDGMTLETFNLLVLNLNRELSAQFQKGGGSYGFVMNYNHATVH